MKKRTLGIIGGVTTAAVIAKVVLLDRQKDGYDIGAKENNRARGVLGKRGNK